MSKRKLSQCFSSKLDQLSSQYPNVYERISKSGRRVPTLTGINYILHSAGIKRVCSIERGCALLLPFLNKEKDKIEDFLSRIYGEELGNFSLLPNEIIVKIFEYVLSDRVWGRDVGFRGCVQDTIPCLGLSRAIRSIVEVAYRNLRNSFAIQTCGFSTGLNLVTHCGLMHLESFLPVDLFQYHKEVRGYFHSHHYESVLNQVEISTLLEINKPLPTDKTPIAFCCSSGDAISLMDWNTIVWNWNYLVIQYRISEYLSLDFTRVYKINKSHFTFLDVVERILLFYQTGFTKRECKDIYDHLDYKLMGRDLDWEIWTHTGVKNPSESFQKLPGFMKLVVGLFGNKEDTDNPSDFIHRFESGLVAKNKLVEKRGTPDENPVVENRLERIQIRESHCDKAVPFWICHPEKCIERPFSPLV